MTAQKQTLIDECGKILRRNVKKCANKRPNSRSVYLALLVAEIDMVILTVLRLPDNHVIFSQPVEQSAYLVLEWVEKEG